MSNRSAPRRLAASADVDKAPSRRYRHNGSARIRQIRRRVREERKLVCELQCHCTTPSAKHFLKQALQTLDLVKNFFLSDEVLRESSAPGEFSRWLNYTEECLQTAIKQREFYEGMLEKYDPAVMLASGHRGVQTAYAARHKSG